MVHDSKKWRQSEFYGIRYSAVLKYVDFVECDFKLYSQFFSHLRHSLYEFLNWQICCFRTHEKGPPPTELQLTERRQQNKKKKRRKHRKGQ